MLITFASATVAINVHAASTIKLPLLFLLWIATELNPYFAYLLGIVVGGIYDLLPYQGMVIGVNEIFYALVAFSVAQLSRRKRPTVFFYLFSVLTSLFFYQFVVALIGRIVYGQIDDWKTSYFSAIDFLEFLIFNLAAAFILYLFIKFLSKLSFLRSKNI
jgi:rod shape-determining protein MreD